MYFDLEEETSKLADLKNETTGIYKLIKKKEGLFGNFLSDKY